MVCTVVARQHGGVQRHARLAAQVGATWDEIAGSILLTEPAFGIVLAMQALPVRPSRVQAGLRGRATKSTTRTRCPTDARVIVGHAPRPRRLARRVPPRVRGLAGRAPADARGDGGGAAPLARRTSPSGHGRFQREHVRGGLPRPGLAARAGRPQRHAPGADGLLRGRRGTQVPALAQPAGPLHLRRLHRRVRHRRAEGALRRPHPQGRDHLVPRHERAQRRQRPGLADHAGRASATATSWSTGRRCGPRARTTPTTACASCAPTPRRRSTVASACSSSTCARPGITCRPLPELTDPGPRRLQRGVLHRRRSARGEPAGRAQSRLGGQPGIAAPRARACCGS